ncbi:MAG: TIGR00725 family protein [Planctomycetota bacterium]
MGRSRIIAVIGASACDARTLETAREVGRRLAEAGCIVVTGGLGGVMEAAAEGAREAGGRVVGILPGPSPDDANPHVEIPVATGMGDARNAVIANTADAFVAVGGAYGTLSEIAFALKRGKRVAALGSWDVDPAVVRVSTPEEAVRAVTRR